MDNFNEFFSRYINNTVVVIAAAKYVEDNCADIPTLSPICYLQIVAVLLTPFVIVKAKYAVRQVVFAFYFYTIIKSDRSSLSFCVIQKLLYVVSKRVYCGVGKATVVSKYV